VATEYFLVINGIAGDYVDPSKLLTGAFQVSSFNLPTLSTASVQPGGAGTGTAVFDPLRLTLTTESLAGLLAASASGTTIKNASLVGVTTTAGGKSAVTYSLNLGNVVISDVNDPNTAQGIGLTLDYGQIGLVTRMQNTSGQLVQTGSFGWNVTQNTATGPGISLTSAGSPSVAPTVPTTYYLLIDGMDGGSVSKGHVGWFKVQDFSIDLTSAFELPYGAPKTYTLKSVWSGTPSPLDSKTMRAEDKQVIHLAPFQVLTFEAVPAKGPQ